jgi:exopolysaccharide production protein ExoY
LALGSLILLFALPIMLAVGLAIYIEDGGAVFFRQPRVGRDRRTFLCIKFRSMVPDAEERMARILAEDPEARREYARVRKLKNDPRVTKVGRWIRRRSLDELPQLLNVIRGEMSLVGPRPILISEESAYGARLTHYCLVRPGMTGLWQVSGRSHASFRSRIAMDMVYVRSQGLALDVKILLATLPVVMLSKGSY